LQKKERERGRERERENMIRTDKMKPHLVSIVPNRDTDMEAKIYIFFITQFRLSLVARCNLN